MKKYILAIICTMLLAITFVGCENTESKETANSEKISVVTTIFPEYDWVREIVGENENVELTMLLDNGVDLHSFQPTTEDIAKVASCDMFIYVGGESDGWVEDALAEATNKDMVVINLLDTLGDSVKEEELVEGMEGEEEAEEEEGPEYDEHVWLSLKNAEILCQKIEEELEKIDADHAEQYQENTNAYVEKLKTLDQEYEEAVAAGSQKTVLFGDRFPFRYLVDDYGLDYYAAFVGCSAESEASFETITFLANKVDELGLTSILQIESSDGKIAETIKENTANQNQQVLVLDSMQATTASDAENGTTYFSVMQSNLEVLKEALK